MASIKHFFLSWLMFLLVQVCDATEWAKVLTGTHLTVVHGSNTTQTFGFYQQRDGSVSTFYKSPDADPDAPWSGGDDNIVVAAGNAIMNTPLAAVSYNLNGITTVCLYYIGSGNQIREVTKSGGGGWVTGDLDKLHVLAADFSQLSAVALVTNGNSLQKAVYYQWGQRQLFQVAIYNGVPAQGTQLLTDNLYSGSQMSFVVANATSTPPEIRGYFQNSTGSLNEIRGYGNSWSRTNFSGLGAVVPPYAGIAATSFPSSKGISLRLYAAQSESYLLEYLYYAGVGWTSQSQLYCPNVRSAGLSALSLFPGSSDVRVYMQQPTNIFSELTNSGSARNFRSGLPGATFATVN